MQLDLQVQQGDFVTVRLNGRVVAEIVADSPQTRDILQEEVARARRLEAVPRILSALLKDLHRAGHLPAEGKGKENKALAFCRGLEEGLSGKTVPHPYPGVPEILAEHNLPYRQGYEYGAALAAADSAFANLTKG